MVAGTAVRQRFANSVTHEAAESYPKIATGAHWATLAAYLPLSLSQSVTMLVCGDRHRWLQKSDVRFVTSLRRGAAINPIPATIEPHAEYNRTRCKQAENAACSQRRAGVTGK